LAAHNFCLSGVDMLTFIAKIFSRSRFSTMSRTEPLVRDMTPAERKEMEELTLQMHKTARTVMEGRARRFPD
jgi:hypothetical protein